MEKVIMEKNSKDLRFKYRNSDGSEASLPPPKLESSASIILISPKNEVLLVHRVKNASTYPSAHVFPGGSHENGQDGRVQKQDMKRYRDCKEYRRTAIRELFEETGILLARDQVTGHYLSLSNEEREKGRSALRAGAVKFQPWIHLMGGMNAWPDIENLHQFTSWITPVSGHQRRFYTQFYLYFLSSPGSKKDNIGIADSSELQAQLPSSASSFSVLSYDSAGRPKPDNEEVLSAEFAKPSTWLSKASQDDIMLFPPQFMLLNILKQHLENPSSRADESSLTSQEIVNHRRQNFISFINGTDISSSPPPSFPPSIDTILPWKRKYISPYSLKSVLRPSLNPRSPDPIPKQVLALDWAGPELCRRALRYGDTSYVILANFTPSGPRSLELLPRSQFMTPTEEKILVLQKGAANTNSKRKKKSPDDMRARILRKAVLRELHEMEVQAANMKKKLSRKGNKGDGNGDNNDEAWTEYRELREHLAIQKRELGLSDESLENVGKEKEEEEEEEAKGFEDDVDVDVDFDAENGDGGIGSLRKSKL